MANEPSWDDIFRPAGDEPARPAPPTSPEPTAYPGVRASDPFAVAAAEAQAQAGAPHTNIHDAPAGTDPDHRLLLNTIAEAKLVMTDALMEKARIEQEQHPIDDDETETVEIADNDDDLISLDDDTDEDSDDADQDTTQETH